MFCTKEIKTVIFNSFWDFTELIIKFRVDNIWWLVNSVLILSETPTMQIVLCCCMWSDYVVSKDSCLDQNISRQKHFCLAENVSEIFPCSFKSCPLRLLGCWRMLRMLELSCFRWVLSSPMSCFCSYFFSWPVLGASHWGV